MKTIDPAILEFLGDINFDSAELARRYAYERDVRLRPERNDQYVEPVAEFSHYADDPLAEPMTRARLNDHVQVAVIGGGYGGLMTGVRLRQAGIADLRIVEKGSDFGGCWYWNRYPGLRCDTEAYVYMLLCEEVGGFPTEKYTRGSEIGDHLRLIAQHFRLYDNACLQTGVTGLRWDGTKGVWHIATDYGDDFTAQFVVMANGLLVKPRLPGIRGIETYRGHTFHSSRWDYDYTGGDESGNLAGLRDKRVGVVGTGATGIQLIPEVAQWAKQLYVFQRTPAAVDVRANRPTDEAWAKSLPRGWQADRIDNFNRAVTGMKCDVDLVNDGFTAIGKLQDPSAAWVGEKIGRPLTTEEADFVNEMLDNLVMERIRARIDSVVKDRATAEALKPWHRRWCKRPLFSDNYLPTFNLPNVKLVDTSGKGINSMTEKGAVVDGKEYEVDCMIFATGFEIGTEFTRRAGFSVQGRGGLELSEYWKDGMRTFHGSFIHNFPNCFLVGWGQSAPATAFTYMLDEQGKHVAYAIAQAVKKGASTIEPTQEAVDAYVAEVNPCSINQLKFWRECIPSYYTSEGDDDNPHGFFANVHPAGPVQFYANLEAWREQGAMQGLTVE